MNPTPTPSPTTTAVNAALSNYWIAVAILLVTAVVIVLVLTFMWLYHRKALDTLTTIATTPGGPPVGIESNDAFSDTMSLVRRIVVVGSAEGQKGIGLMYVLQGLEPNEKAEWKVDGATVEVVANNAAIVKFTKDGTHTVDATVMTKTDDDKWESIAQPVRPLKVTIAPAKATAATAIMIPFVVKNWGRLVVIILGAGLISTLMALRVLDSAAGIGALGVLLGVGVTTTATAGTTAGASPNAPTQQQKLAEGED